MLAPVSDTLTELTSAVEAWGGMVDSVKIWIETGIDVGGCDETDGAQDAIVIGV